MTVTYPPMLRGRGGGAPPKAISEHRAGKFFLYRDLPEQVVKAIGKRVLAVRAFHHDGYIEIHGWCEDFEPGVLTGQELPHYRWMYDTETFELTCVMEEATTVPNTMPPPAVDRPPGEVPPAGGDAAKAEPQGVDHGLQQEDPAGVKA
jgi:hypothetical protein